MGVADAPVVVTSRRSGAESCNSPDRLRSGGDQLRIGGPRLAGGGGQVWPYARQSQRRWRLPRYARRLVSVLVAMTRSSVDGPRASGGGSSLAWWRLPRPTGVVACCGGNDDLAAGGAHLGDEESRLGSELSPLGTHPSPLSALPTSLSDVWTSTPSLDRTQRAVAESSGSIARPLVTAVLPTFNHFTFHW